jgi:hypothetical protein
MFLIQMLGSISWATKSSQISQPFVATDSFPYELLLEIFSHLNGQELVATSRVCRSWQCVAEDQNLWKALYLRENGEELQDEEIEEYKSFFKNGYVSHPLLQTHSMRLLPTEAISMSLTADGSTLLLLDKAGDICLYDTATLNVQERITGKNCITAIISPDGAFIYLVSKALLDRWLSIPPYQFILEKMDRFSGETSINPVIHTYEEINNLEVSPNGQRILLKTKNNAVLYEASSLQEIRCINQIGDSNVNGFMSDFEFWGRIVKTGIYYHNRSKIIGEIYEKVNLMQEMDEHLDQTGNPEKFDRSVLDNLHQLNINLNVKRKRKKLSGLSFSENSKECMLGYSDGTVEFFRRSDSFVKDPKKSLSLGKKNCITFLSFTRFEDCIIVGARNQKGKSVTYYIDTAGEAIYKTKTPASQLSSQDHTISHDRSTWAKLSEGHRFLTAYKLPQKQKLED